MRKKRGSKPKSSTSQAPQLRIIGGQWRSRKLAVADIPGLRPSGDRTREMLFNWLMPIIDGATCLDLFAGTGALGLESLSRGANKAWMIEKHPQAAAVIRDHVTELEATEAAHIINGDALALATLAKQHHISPCSIDIAFIDPPFAESLWESSIDALEQSQLLAPAASIYLEAPKGYVAPIPSKWHLSKQKDLGAISCFLYEVTS